MNSAKRIFGLRARTALRLGMALVVVIIAGAGVAAAFKGLRGSEREIPTIRVKRGVLELKVYTTGELRPAKSAMLVAPSVGGTLQLVHLAPSGTMVHAGEVAAEFDPSEQEYNLEQSRFDFQQAEQQIIKTKADSTVQASQDQVDLLTAKYNVRKAELDVSKNEILSVIDAKKNLLALDEAKRHLAQLEQDIQSRVVSNQAQLAVLQEQRNHAKLSMDQIQKRIESMTLRASISGMLVARENRDASGTGFYFPGTIPDYKEGDVVSPGRLVAEILEVSDMEILSRVSESDRGNLNPGQAVEIRVDARPAEVLRGKVKTISGMASRGWGVDPTLRFDTAFQLDEAHTDLRPGVTAQVIIVGNKVNDALYVPRQALYEKDGKPVVYVKNGNRFEPREVKIKYRSETSVAIEGVSEGTEVALVNPEQEAQKPGQGGAVAPAGGLGGGGK